MGEQWSNLLARRAYSDTVTLPSDKLPAAAPDGGITPTQAADSTHVCTHAGLMCNSCATHLDSRATHLDSCSVRPLVRLTLWKLQKLVRRPGCCTHVALISTHVELMWDSC